MIRVIEYKTGIKINECYKLYSPNTADIKLTELGRRYLVKIL